MKKKSIMTACAVTLAMLLFALLLYRTGDVKSVYRQIADATERWPFLVAGVALFSVSLLCGVTRWFVMLRTLNLRMSYWEAVRLYATGHFFSVLVPGATGGDVVKAAWVAMKFPGSRTKAITSIAAERIIGLIAMVVFVTAIASCRRDFFSDNKTLSLLRHVIFAGCTFTIVSLVLLLCVNWGRLIARIHAKPGHWLEKILHVILNIWQTLRVCLLHPLATTAAFLLSLLNHFVDVCCYFLLSRAIGMTLPFRDLLVISPISNTIAAIPLTPGGAGVRENALQSMMEFVNVPLEQSAALGICMYGTIIIWALVCGIILLATPKLHIPK